MQAIFDNHGFNETTTGKLGPPDSSGNPTSIKYDHTPNINSNNPTTSQFTNLYNISTQDPDSSVSTSYLFKDEFNLNGNRIEPFNNLIIFILLYFSISASLSVLIIESIQEEIIQVRLM